MMMQTVENAMLGQTLSGGATTRNECNAAVDDGEQVDGHVLEELKATDDEAGADYSVGVYFDMSVGPQFIPLGEMKEKNELLDTWDDGDNSDNGGDGGDVGDGGDRGAGDDGAPIGKIPLKRKAPKQKKKASAKK
ncbi:hypothetical protein LWI29_025422 [Acer saccharum]|uniref:Uncharacterized protein n=1 Tax=Acer saccharum TaxID=4024 RepID=A0AA39W326_ACESA|nr:hypothetical protein LWI29_025422 [Acer saccharum]